MANLWGVSGTVLAGIPEKNPTLYRQVRFLVGDPAAWLSLSRADGTTSSLFIVRDIELQRAQKHARADEVFCPADFAPAEGLSGDRETATAQAVAECLRSRGIQQVVVDRSLPMIFAHFIAQAGIAVNCDIEWGVVERRQKDAEEIEWLRAVQRLTEETVARACRTVAAADVNAEGGLMWEGEPLTSERLRAMTDVWLLEQGCESSPSIIAGGPQGGDCHERGSGPLRTEEPVIVDIFPRHQRTRYYGDCTRTVVHGELSPQLTQMHAAVMAAKAAGEAACRSGASGEDVHRATIAAITAHGFQTGLPPENAPADYCAMTHGTGHGVGLEVHEPPLLDFGGPPLVRGDALTIEPGLYCQAVGGVRVEDMVIVTDDGCENLNSIPTGLNWD